MRRLVLEPFFFGHRRELTFLRVGDDPAHARDGSIGKFHRVLLNLRKTGDRQHQKKDDCERQAVEEDPTDSG